MKYDPTNQLDIKMAHFKVPDRGLSYGGKGLDKEIIQGLTFRQSFFELIGLCLKLIV